MTQYCYVKSGLGTRVTATGFTALETGAFGSGNLTAANVYASRATALSSNTLVAGDHILSSDVHSVIASADTTHTITAGVILASVDNANADAAATTTNYAVEGTTGATNQLLIYNSVADAGAPLLHYSMQYSSGDLLGFRGCHELYDCRLAAGDSFTYPTSDGSALNMYGGRVTFSNIANVLRLQNGCRWRFCGVDFALDSIARINQLIDSRGSAGGMYEFIGCDLSTLWDGTSSGPIVECSATTDDVINVRFIRCKLPVTDPSGGRISAGSNSTCEVSFIGCGDSANDAFSIEHHFHRGTMVSEIGTSHFRSGDVKLPDATNYLSYKLSSNANASRTNPFRVFVPMRYEGDYTSNGKCTIYVSGPSGLLNSDVWQEAMYADGTSAMLWRRAHTAKTGSDGRIDPIGTGAALTADGTTWTGGGTNDYSMEATLTSGGDGLVGVYICLGKPSTDVYVSSTVGLNA